jgi:two-component system, NarL family, sensor kinase
VEVVETDEGVSMQIRDDGHGFDPEGVVPDPDGQSGIGVVGMHERLRLLGGRLDVESGPDGTAVRAFLPRWSATPES